MVHYDIVIVGAGPAGCAAALTLADADCRVLLLDRKHFPRDKVCGDAIPGPAVRALRSIAPRYADSLESLAAASVSRSTALYLNGRAPLTLKWVTRAYTCPRKDFDNHLFGLAAGAKNVTVRTGVGLSGIERERGQWRLQVKSDTIPTTCTFLIGADGAQSVVARRLTGRSVDRDHYGGAVRQYHRGVTATVAHRLEIHTLRAFMPGYFWLFPLADGSCNVGFGMHATAIKSKGLNLRRSIADFIAHSPTLSDRFRGAEATEPVRGFGLPFGSRRPKVSGEGYLLAGDAAHLVDPLTGDGIGQAVISGILAARQALECVACDDVSTQRTAAYDRSLWNAIGGELRVRTGIVRAHQRAPWLVDVAATCLQFGPLRRAVQRRL